MNDIDIDDVRKAAIDDVTRAIARGPEAVRHVASAWAVRAFLAGRERDEALRASDAAVLAEREACAAAVRAMKDDEAPGTDRRDAFAEAVLAITSRK